MIILKTITIRLKLVYFLLLTDNFRKQRSHQKEAWGCSSWLENNETALFTMFVSAKVLKYIVIQSAGAVEYTNCTSAEG